MRYYREEGRLEDWDNAYNRIVQMTDHLSQEIISQLHYEHSLYALFNLDIQKLKTSLTEWKSNDSLPFSEAKKAGLLAEIGQTEEAVVILEKSLKLIREKLNLKPISTDYTLISQESYAMLLLQYVQSSLSFRSFNFQVDQEIQKKFSERLNALAQYKCDPWNELKLFESALERPPLKIRETTENQEYDIGRKTVTLHYGSWDKETILAYNFLRFCEDTGIPFRIPSSNIAKESASGTLSRIAKSSPFWAMATMVRLGDIKAVDQIFNRESLSQMTTDSVDNLIEGYLNALELSADDIRLGTRFYTNNFGIVLAKVVPEILSRLCCKCSPESKCKLLVFLLKVYCADYRSNFEGIRNLTKRLLGAFPIAKRFSLITQLLDFPILGSLHFTEEREYTNPFLFLALDKVKTQGFDTPEINEEQVKVYLEYATSANHNERKWAATTLIELYKLGLLSNSQAEQFTKVLWRHVDSFGLPENTGYYKFIFLDLPSPTGVDPTLLFKKFIQNEAFPIQKNSTKKGISMTGGNIPLCEELLGSAPYIHWNFAEIIVFFNRTIEWWDADKEYLEKETPRGPLGSITEEFTARFSLLVDLLANVISPNLTHHTDWTTKETLFRIIYELRDHELPALRLESASLHLYPEFDFSICQSIENALSSHASNIVIDALWAVWKIIDRESQGSNYRHTNRCLLMICQMLQWRHSTALQSVLELLKRIFKNYPILLNSETEHSVLIGLRNIQYDATSGIESFPFSDMLAIKKHAASLAYNIFLIHREQGKRIPSVIEKWKSICNSSEEFAEISNQWISF